MKVFIFGGTTEGRQAAEEYINAGHEVTVSVATEVGAEELKGLPVRTLVGRLDESMMEKEITGYELVIDATHPYAVMATKNIREACVNKEMAYQRIERDLDFNEGLPKKYHLAYSHEEAAAYLSLGAGNILLTTGSKNLVDYRGLAPERLYARVLPTHEALNLCEDGQIPHSHIIAMHGPFSKELNTAMIRQYDIKYLVSKQSGMEGGFFEKSAAADECDIEMVIILAPQ